MNPNEVYERILEELTAGEMTELQRQIFTLLRDHPDGLTRRELVFHIKGYRPISVDGNKDDRKIRKAIEKLRQRLFPIVSTSGKPGYRLDTSRESAEKMVAELRSRKANIEVQINAVSKFHQLPAIPTAYKPPRRVRVRKSEPGIRQLEMAL